MVQFFWPTPYISVQRLTSLFCRLVFLYFCCISFKAISVWVIGLQFSYIWRLNYCIVSTSGQSCACVSKENCRLELHSTRFRPFFQSESRIALVQIPGFSGLKIAYCIIMCSQNWHILRQLYQNICCTAAAVNHLFWNYSCLSPLGLYLQRLSYFSYFNTT